MPSVNPHTARLGVLAVCVPLAIGGLAGCSTTQEKAERAQAQAKHILDARAERQKRKHDKSKQGQGKKRSEKQ